MHCYLCHPLSLPPVTAERMSTTKPTSENWTQMMIKVFSAGLVLVLGRLGELDPTTDLVVFPIVETNAETERPQRNRGGNGN